MGRVLGRGLWWIWRVLSFLGVVLLGIIVAALLFGYSVSLSEPLIGPFRARPTATAQVAAAPTLRPTVVPTLVPTLESAALPDPTSVALPPAAMDEREPAMFVLTRGINELGFHNPEGDAPFSYLPGGDNFGQIAWDVVPPPCEEGDWVRIWQGANLVNWPWTSIFRNFRISESISAQAPHSTLIIFEGKGTVEFDLARDLYAPALLELKGQHGVDPYSQALVQTPNGGLGWFFRGNHSRVFVNGEVLYLTGSGDYQLGFPRDMTGVYYIRIEIEERGHVTFWQGERMSSTDNFPLPPECPTFDGRLAGLSWEDLEQRGLDLDTVREDMANQPVSQIVQSEEPQAQAAPTARPVPTATTMAVGGGLEDLEVEFTVEPGGNTVTLPLGISLTTNSVAEDWARTHVVTEVEGDWLEYTLTGNGYNSDFPDGYAEWKGPDGNWQKASHWDVISYVRMPLP